MWETSRNTQDAARQESRSWVRFLDGILRPLFQNRVSGGVRVAREWWRTSRSLEQIAEHVAQVLRDREEIEQRLNEVLQENARLLSSCEKANADLATERKRQSGYLQQATVATKERLMKDELVRTVQELQVELKRERQRLGKEIEDLKSSLSTCLCHNRFERRLAPKRKADLETDPWLQTDCR
jgi:chromosome segregation ATPase